MGQLNWRPIVAVRVPEGPRVRWTLAREFVPPGKLLMLRVKQVPVGQPAGQGAGPPAGGGAGPAAAAAPVAAAAGVPAGAPAATQPATWKPEGMDPPCDADGDLSHPPTPSVTLPLARAARGALIGRIGGSTADETPDDKSMLLFAVGRLCVLQVPDDKRGSLFLAVNDRAEAAVQIQGSLEVEIFEAL
jgi:hypothetical protein